MVIKILGTGCAGCKTLYETTQKAVEELGMTAQIVKVEDMMQILTYQTMQLPALVVDEKVVAKGRLNLQQVKDVLSR